MREHKFQAWCHGKLYKPFTLRDAGEYDISIDEEVEKGTERITCSWPEDTIFRQYTGLKDKNGKEIYEGDICMEIYQLADISAPIEFSNGSFWFGSHPLWEFTNKELKIIGNIYENPELGGE